MNDLSIGPLINRWYWQFRVEGLSYTLQGSMPAASEAEALDRIKVQLQCDYPGKKLMMEEFRQEREMTNAHWRFYSVW